MNYERLLKSQITWSFVVTPCRHIEMPGWGKVVLRESSSH